MMTREEIKNRLEENNKRQFMIQMIDRWTASDTKAIRKLWQEERELKEMLERLEG